ncbi:hypothetical protein PF005_g692 [Phytophthora fragariae]|uniref:Uncharacterized protein n=1 Tax=Phytophthora fragariae TaxID=53985 RepID=A0A6A3ZLM0_9STRA|nr:hypothetical protein PF003_g8394 [Phytophthora fragariae]KAE9031552.1 hypothetical protein PF011_g7 [Phytophthora fragariae]KAE9140214.1 hypothetical protein PF010_g287 [Phytophthora fragariae]KAE9141339.1 hypothetical protein PF007_g295 [Phytophthora fragariae]KAE9155496.1 hypothetical protein PF006_g546 [Phytophthora fragariae]
MQPFEMYYRGTQTGWNLVHASPNCALAAINALFEASGHSALNTDEVWTDFLSKNHFDKKRQYGEGRYTASRHPITDAGAACARRIPVQAEQSLQGQW